MMQDSYIEVMVKQEKSMLLTVCRIGLVALTAVFTLLALLGFWVLILPDVICGVLAYVCTLYAHVEYEYTYVDKELQIDRILGQARRKRMETLDLQQLEILAPLGSHQLGGGPVQGEKRTDYSSGRALQPERRYVLRLNGRQYLIEPGEEMVKLLRSIFPRKVFTY